MDAGIYAIIGTIITAATAVVIDRRHDARQRDEKLSEIHVLVNNRLDEALAEIRKLKGALSDRGVDPDDV